MADFVVAWLCVGSLIIVVLVGRVIRSSRRCRRKGQLIRCRAHIDQMERELGMGTQSRQLLAMSSLGSQAMSRNFAEVARQDMVQQIRNSK